MTRGYERIGDAAKKKPAKALRLSYKGENDIKNLLAYKSTPSGGDGDMANFRDRNLRRGLRSFSLTFRPLPGVHEFALQALTKMGGIPSNAMKGG